MMGPSATASSPPPVNEHRRAMGSQNVGNAQPPAEIPGEDTLVVIYGAGEYITGSAD